MKYCFLTIVTQFIAYYFKDFTKTNVKSREEESILAGTGIYLTWVTSALLSGILLLPFFKPKWAKVNLRGFVDMFRRYWLHIALVFSIYLWKDIVDGLDRTLMASTRIEMTPLVYAIEGDIVLYIQQLFLSETLTFILTHFYTAGYMFVCYVSILYFVYFDDRYLADKVCLSSFFVYALAVPFFLFFNVRVTGQYIPEMESLAYNLTPEINDWFTRIDPFTNDMPSLHIGLPFTVWLVLVRYDEDGRWNRYRNFLACFLVLTAFAIVYLGIHWIVDILGGMIVGWLAVEFSERWSNSVWNICDERTINGRLVTLFTQPERTKVWLSKCVNNLFQRITNPRSTETGFAIIGVLILTSGVLVWDVTHRELLIGDVERPLETNAADGWIASVDDIGAGNYQVLVHDLSNPELEGTSLPWESSSNEIPVIAVAGEFVAIANNTGISIFNIIENKIISQISVDSVSEIQISLEDKGTTTIVANSLGDLRLFDISGTELVAPDAPPNSENLLEFSTAKGELVLIYDDQPSTIRHGDIGRPALISIPIDVTTPIEDEEMISWGISNIDYDNQKITDIDTDGRWAVATVNVSAVDRLVLIDLLTGDTTLLSDPKYPSVEADVGHGIVVWSSQLNLRPDKQYSDYEDFEIQYYIIETGIMYEPTKDKVNQREPHSIENYLIWLEEQDEGPPKIVVYSLEKEIENYSRVVLQISILLLVPLLAFYAFQRQKENSLLKLIRTEEE